MFHALVLSALTVAAPTAEANPATPPPSSFSTDPNAVPPLPPDPLSAATEAARLAAEAARDAAQALKKCTLSPGMLHTDIPMEVPEPSPFSFKLGLSALAVGGNANAWSGKLDAGIDGNWHDWNAEFRLTGAYGQTSDSYIAARPISVTSSTGGVSLRGERNFNPIVGVYLKAGSSFDRVGSVSWRVGGEAGISLLWWEDKLDDFVRSRLRTSLGFAGIHESRYQYYPYPLELDPTFKNIFGPTITVNVRYGLSRKSFFTEDVELLEDINDAHDLRVTSVTGLTAQLKDGIAMSITFTWHHIGSPPEGKKPDDYELAAGLNWTW